MALITLSTGGVESGQETRFEMASKMASTRGDRLRCSELEGTIKRETPGEATSSHRVEPVETSESGSVSVVMGGMWAKAYSRYPKRIWRRLVWKVRSETEKVDFFVKKYYRNVSCAAFREILWRGGAVGSTSISVIAPKYMQRLPPHRACGQAPVIRYGDFS